MADKYIPTQDTDVGYNNNFKVIRFECAVPEKDTMMAYTAALQSKAEHPIAKAILKALPPITLSDYTVDKFEKIPGCGIKGFVHGHEVIIGNIAWMKSYDFYYDESLDHVNEKVVIVMIDDRYTGCFFITETTA